MDMGGVRMNQYHKIQSVYKRDPETKYQTLLDGQYSLPEFELLKDIKWVFTEKVDGTNIRVIWDGEKINFKGKTDNAQMHDYMLDTLNNTFKYKKIVFKETFDTTPV